MLRFVLAALVLFLFVGSTLAQTAKQSGSAKPKMKTIRLHIDGFQKSKSGAI